ncbi:RNA polymerase sigma-70 factor [Leadbetterella sp. DM7]|uniref:RNA polymerase sigma-70 factor n=1 Tax=Leadbetterella sp. DM7 TaxID=3235085 RepID=UPI00349E5FBD
MYEKYSRKSGEENPSEKLRISSENEEDSGKGIVLDEESYLRRLFKMSPEKGFDLLFRKYYGQLCSHCVRFVHSKAFAEDIVSEIFVNFWQKKVYEHIDTSFKAYLYKSVRFRSYNFLKKEFLRETNEIRDVDFARKSPVDKPDDILFYHELANRLDKIIRSLPAQSRKAFQMSRLEGMKYSEIAREMNITISAVERLISRALDKIRTELRSDSTQNQ